MEGVPQNIYHLDFCLSFCCIGFDPSKIYREEDLKAGVSLFSIFKGKENLMVNSFKQG